VGGRRAARAAGAARARGVALIRGLSVGQSSLSLGVARLGGVSDSALEWGDFCCKDCPFWGRPIPWGFEVTSSGLLGFSPFRSSSISL
jgi:hypothetical protein